MQDLKNEEYRKSVLDEILGPENLERKAESFRRSEIYNLRAAPYIEQRLKKEFPKSSSSMRKVLSINPAKRIIDKQASVYSREPERSVIVESDVALSDEQEAFIEETYSEGKYNSAMLLANRVRKFQHQCAIQVIPFRGVISPRIYQPHQYDVIPMEDDPETAFAYITSAYDKSKALSGGDGVNQRIADANDGKTDDARARMRFVWWSNEFNFLTDGNGVITSGEEVLNPVGDHCFIDSAEQKENEFFVRRGAAVADFVIDLAIVLSDTANINRLQGFAQMVLISDQPASDFETGPENAIRLPLAKDGEGQPDVKFVSPNPNLDASISLITNLISLFLTSYGEDARTVNTQGNSTEYKSGLDRFLAQMEQFDASRSDYDHFRWVESEIFRLIALWANHFAGSSNSPLKKVEAVALPADAYMQVNFQEPQLFTTEKDQQEALFELMAKGLRSAVQVLMEIDGLDQEGAIAKLAEIKKHNQLASAQMETNPKPAAQAGAEAPGAQPEVADEARA